jgi:hypothetical protein
MWQLDWDEEGVEDKRKTASRSVLRAVLQEPAQVPEVRNMPFDVTLEARHILARAASTHAPAAEDQAKAAGELLDQLLRLQIPGVEMIPDKRSGKIITIRVRMGDVNVLLHYLREQHLFRTALPDDADTVDIPLRYNALHHCFEGTTPDTFFQLAPGEPVRIRPALAVLAEALARRSGAS